MQCETGLLSVTGAPEQPAKAGISVADIAAGMYAMSSILAALYRRTREGIGATLDITMFEALGEWMGFPAYFTAYGGEAPARTGAHHATIVPYGPFKAGDGGTVFLAIQNEREFERFCDLVLGKPSLKADPRFASGPARASHRDAMHSEIEKIFSKKTTTKIVKELEQAGIANARLNSMQEFWDHPQLEARDRWREVGSPGGPIDAMKPPFNLDGFEPRMDAVPALGEHSRTILADLGFTSMEIQQMERAKIVQQGGTP